MYGSVESTSNKVITVGGFCTFGEHNVENRNKPASLLTSEFLPIVKFDVHYKIFLFQTGFAQLQ